MHWRRKWQPTPVFMSGESQGRWSLVGCHLWGHTESNTTAEKYLNDNKIEDTNRELLGTSADYWQKHKFEIIKYLFKPFHLSDYVL